MAPTLAAATLAASRTAGGVVGGVIAVGAAAAVYATTIEPRAFRIRAETLAVLPPGAKPITVLHLADIHLAPWQSAKLEWLRGLASTEPDLVINTGDNVGHQASLPLLADAFEVFRDVPGFYVHGSNDVYGPQFKNPLGYLAGPSKESHDFGYVAGRRSVADLGRPSRLDTPALERAFDDLGWLNLNNTARAFEIRGTSVLGFGVHDAHRHWDSLVETEAGLFGAREVLPDGPRVTLGVTHAPYRRILDGFIELGADAIFAGHTHGGQVRIPGGHAIVTNCDLPRRHASGLTRWSNGRHEVPLNVSQGIGSSIFAPFRFGTPPEAVIVSLVPKLIG